MKKYKSKLKIERELRPGHDYIGVGGGVLILNDRNETLLTRRTKNTRNNYGYWAKPGGMVEYGEKAIVAMKREVKEELGINIDIWGGLPNTDHIIKSDKQHWMALNFLGKIKSGKVQNLEPHKCAEIKWFSLKKMPKKMAQPTRESVNNYLQGKYIKL